jgi:hypothetical protein
MSTKPELADVAQLTALMRAEEQKLARLADRRRAAILRHRQSDPPASYADLAEACNMSQARLYKVIKGKGDSVPRGRRAPSQ